MDNIKDIIKEMNTLFKARYPDFKGIYFFGSRSRGDNNASSDYDFVFTFARKIDWQFEKEIIAQIFPFTVKYDVIIDPRIYNFSEIENPATPFRMNVKKDSIFYAV